jgi:hypothetical protein
MGVLISFLTMLISKLITSEAKMNSKTATFFCY